MPFDQIIQQEISNTAASQFPVITSSPNFSIQSPPLNEHDQFLSVIIAETETDPNLDNEELKQKMMDLEQEITFAGQFPVIPSSPNYQTARPSINELHESPSAVIPQTDDHPIPNAKEVLKRKMTKNKTAKLEKKKKLRKKKKTKIIDPSKTTQKLPTIESASSNSNKSKSKLENAKDANIRATERMKKMIEGEPEEIDKPFGRPPPRKYVIHDGYVMNFDKILPLDKGGWNAGYYCRNACKGPNQNGAITITRMHDKNGVKKFNHPHHPNCKKATEEEIEMVEEKVIASKMVLSKNAQSMRKHRERYAGRLRKMIEGEPEEIDKPYGRPPPRKGIIYNGYKYDIDTILAVADGGWTAYYICSNKCRNWDGWKNKFSLSTLRNTNNNFEINHPHADDCTANVMDENSKKQWIHIDHQISGEVEKEKERSMNEEENDEE